MTAIVREEESEKEVAITLNATDTKKVQLRGTDTNYGYWTQIGNSNMVCSWTDYSFTLTPSEDTGRLSNGYWTPTNKNRTYGYCVNNATITFTAPDSYQITSVKFFGDAASSVELSGNCNITPSSAVAFAGNSHSDNRGTSYFEVVNHVSGEPLTISVTNGQCNI